MSAQFRVWQARLAHQPTRIARVAWITAAALIAAVGLHGQAHAALGGDVASVDADRTRIKASVRIQPGAAYTTHELQTPSGTTVREFSRPDGKIFAVRWSGPTVPDLRQLLGTYFSEYVTADGSRRGAHAHRAVEHDDLVVHSSGHMRAFSGTAYVPSLVPTGVVIDALQ